MSNGPLTVQITPAGPNPPAMTAARRAALRDRRVKALLKGAEHRVLSTAPVHDEPGPRTRAVPPRRARTLIYDYTNNRTIRVEGALDGGGELTVTELAAQPPVTTEEFEAAAARVRADRRLGKALESGRLTAYHPMPPLLAVEGPDGVPERSVTVGLRPADRRGRHEIVAVNMTRGTLVRFADGAPEGSQAAPATCGPPDAGQGFTDQGIVGSAQITVRRGTTVLWRLHATRPSASGGSEGSGIDLRNVDYRGKRVLRRAHVPILNVRYDRDACGPYRDWQFAESPFTANGTNPATGFRLCPTPARTVLDGAPDHGNFAGVAVYVDGEEVVLVSELEAGWYRYVSQWRFHSDGTIRPRFGFGAVDSTCVCNPHHHHAYWRLNFDIGAAAHDRVGEWNDPPGPQGGSWRTLRFEQRRPKAPAWHRKWRVINTQTLAGYELRPGDHDGTADAFGVGDLWVLQLRPDQIDDAAVRTSDRAAIDAFVSGEVVEDRDVVVWYGAHFRHVVEGTAPPHGDDHIVGPDLVPFGW
jgi:hypothetical protein